MRPGPCSSWCRELRKRTPWPGCSGAIRRCRPVTWHLPTASFSSSSTAPRWAAEDPLPPCGGGRGGGFLIVDLLPRYHLTCDLTRPTLSDILVTQRLIKDYVRAGKASWRSRGQIGQPSATGIGSSGVGAAGSHGRPRYGWRARQPGACSSSAWAGWARPASTALLGNPYTPPRGGRAPT